MYAWLVHDIGRQKDGATLWFSVWTGSSGTAPAAGELLSLNSGCVIWLTEGWISLLLHYSIMTLTYTYQLYLLPISISTHSIQSSVDGRSLQLWQILEMMCYLRSQRNTHRRSGEKWRRNQTKHEKWLADKGSFDPPVYEVINMQQK